MHAQVTVINTAAAASFSQTVSTKKEEEKQYRN